MTLSLLQALAGSLWFERALWQCNGGLVPLAGKEGAGHEPHSQHLLGKLCKDPLCAATRSGFGVRLRKGSVYPKVTQLSCCLSEGMGQTEGFSGKKNMGEERGKVNLNMPLLSFPRFTL